jgi:hypothetical protein
VRGWDAGLQQVIADAGEVAGGGAVGLVLAECLHDQAADVLDLTVGELVRAGLPLFRHAGPHPVRLGQRDECLVQPGQVRGPVIGQGELHAQD